MCATPNNPALAPFEALAQKIWRSATAPGGDRFKEAAETFHILAEETEDQPRRSDLITLRNIATYRAANP